MFFYCNGKLMQCSFTAMGRYCNVPLFQWGGTAMSFYCNGKYCYVPFTAAGRYCTVFLMQWEGSIWVMDIQELRLYFISWTLVLHDWATGKCSVGYIGWFYKIPTLVKFNVRLGDFFHTQLNWYIRLIYNFWFLKRICNDMYHSNY